MNSSSVSPTETSNVWASFSVGQSPTTYVVVIGAVIAGYMALNVGANDVANNMGPAVGSRAISMTGALIIAPSRTGAV